MPDSPNEGAWQLRFGANLREDGAVEFRVWAPNLTNLAVRILGENPQTVSMTRNAEAEFVATVPNTGVGSEYFYVLDGEHERPDPVSRWQPRGVNGPSRVLNPNSFRWSDQALVRHSAERLHHLRTPHRHLHARGHIREHHSATSISSRSRYHRSRDYAGRRVSRKSQLGIRRRQPLPSTIFLRRPHRPEETCRRLPCSRTRGGDGRCLQPPRSGRELSSRVCPLFHRRLSHALGQGHQL